MHCDQCEMLSINGMACHETGCPNARKTWDDDREEWIRYVECRECGCEVEAGTSCDCQEPCIAGQCIECGADLYDGARLCDDCTEDPEEEEDEDND